MRPFPCAFHSDFFDRIVKVLVGHLPIGILGNFLAVTKKSRRYMAGKIAFDIEVLVRRKPLAGYK